MQEAMEAISGEKLLIALGVLLAILWILRQVMEFVLSLRKLRSPQAKKDDDLTAHQIACDRKFANDKKRLDDLEPRMDSVEEGQRVLCKGMYEMLSHLLHNGNKEQMEKASSDLFDYLNK